jgi:hypothetical protein
LASLSEPRSVSLAGQHPLIEVEPLFNFGQPGLGLLQIRHSRLELAHPAFIR